MCESRTDRLRADLESWATDLEAEIQTAEGTALTDALCTLECVGYMLASLTPSETE